MRRLVYLGKLFFVLALCSALMSCTMYTEKQSEALSQTVYLADESFELGRFDVTDIALDQAVRIVKPPKKKVEVGALEKQAKTKPSAVETPTVANKQILSKNRVVIVPARFKSMEVIVVGSIEYQQLIEDQQNLAQLQLEHNRLTQLKQTVDEELQQQQQMNNQMVIRLNQYKEEVLSKSLTILKLQITIIVLIAAIGAGIYLRIKGIL